MYMAKKVSDLSLDNVHFIESFSSTRLGTSVFSEFCNPSAWYSSWAVVDSQ